MPDAQTDAAAAALLATLSARLGRVTGSLEELLARFRSDEGAWAGEDRMGAAVGSAAELGWLFSLLAYGAGADLYPERHEPGGLVLTAQLLRETLRSLGRELLLPADLPRLRPEGGRPLCWALARLAWQAACEQPAGASLVFVFPPGCDEACWSIDAPPGPELSALGAQVERLLPGCRFERGSHGARLWFPANWIELR